MNSAHTWVDIRDMLYLGMDGKYVNYLSESGSLEVFLFSSSTADQHGFNRFKKIQKNLADITGYAPLPPSNALGFHYCKWAHVSAEIIMKRNKDFTDYGFPVDHFWMDIGWADQYSRPGYYEYFKFNP